MTAESLAEGTPAGEDRAPAGAERARTVVTITDPQAIRALAHKVRLDVIDELFGSEDTYTATDLAKRFGLTPSAMSYHLRALEKWGYLVRAEPSADGRERLWKAAGETLEVGDKASASALVASTLIDIQLASLRDRVKAALAAASAAGEDGDAEDLMLAQSKLRITDAESKEFQRRYHELVDEFRQRHRSGTEPGLKKMHLTAVLIPEIEA
ncbi:MAG: ArsR/SmtB family transcription factor [Actinomycetales bacterium]|jgi:DNA-binding transcriptional ArsR family regulator